jgi:hypothetical protein
MWPTLRDVGKASEINDLCPVIHVAPDGSPQGRPSAARTAVAAPRRHVRHALKTILADGGIPSPGWLYSMPIISSSSARKGKIFTYETEIESLAEPGEEEESENESLGL